MRPEKGREGVGKEGVSEGVLGLGCAHKRGEFLSMLSWACIAAMIVGDTLLGRRLGWLGLQGRPIGGARRIKVVWWGLPLL